MPEPAAPIRALWSGTVSFGLVTIPVELFPATRSTAGVSFRLLGPEGTPLQREYWCPAHEAAVSSEEIVRGYELDDGSFVVLEENELDALAPEASRDIAIERFVARDDLPPLWFERGYLLLPSTEVTKAYGLLAEVLERSARVGIGRFVMRGHGHVVAIAGEDGLLRIEILRFAEQLRTPEDVGLPEAEKVDADEVEQLRELIDEHTLDEFDAHEFADEHAQRVFARARKKLAAGEDVVETAEPGEGRAPAGEIIDLMQVLAQRVAHPGRREPPTSPPPSPPTPAKLREQSKQQLYERAQQLGIEGRSRMSKAELVAAIARRE